MRRLKVGETKIVSANTIELKLTVTKEAGESLVPLLKYIKSLAGMGHSFSIAVDPDNKEYLKMFDIDGDGNSHIKIIEICEE